jgi:hypothetical protein
MYTDPSDNERHHAPLPDPTYIPDDLGIGALPGADPGFVAVFNHYMELKRTPGTWNNFSPGNFSVWQFLALILSEFEFEGDATQNAPDLAETVIDNFYLLCQGNFGCDFNNPYDVLYYIFYRGLDYKVRTVTPVTVGQKESKQINPNFNPNPTDFMSTFRNHPKEWETPGTCGDRPCEWGNYSVPETCKRNGCTWGTGIDWGQVVTNYGEARKNTNPKADKPCTDQKCFYFIGGSGDAFLILTGNQRTWLYHGK